VTSSAQLVARKRAAIARLGESAPDLTRTVADGYALEVRYLPDLARPKRAIVTIAHDGRTIDTLDVPASDGLAVFRHASLHSAAYRDALNYGAPDVDAADVAERIAAYIRPRGQSPLGDYLDEHGGR